MRLVLLYLRTRLAARAAACLVAIATLTALYAHLTSPTTSATLLITVAPLAIAATIAASVRSPFGDLESSTGRLPGVLQFGQLLSLLLTGAAALALATSGSPIADSAFLLTRNLFGFTGAALLVTAFLNGPVAWVVPLVYSGLTLRVEPATRWAWSLHGATDREAMAVALALLTTGLMAMGVARPRANTSADEGL